MSNFYCVKCGLEAFGKCCHCRNVYASHTDKTVEMIETVMSHRLLLDDPTKLKVKLFREETWGDALIVLRDLLKDRTDAECKIFGCTHEWDFKPFAKSTIDCGHGSEEKPLIDYMSDAWYYLNDREDATPGDVKAAEIINKALEAIDAGAEIDFGGKYYPKSN